MSPIPLGTLAASGGPPPSDFDLLETVILTDVQTVITFENLFSTYALSYNYLQLRYVARTNRTDGLASVIEIDINSDSSPIYEGDNIRGNGADVLALPQLNRPQIRIGLMPQANSASGAFSGGIIDLFEPFSNNKNTIIQALSGSAQDLNQQVGLFSGIYNSLASVDSFSLLSNGAFIAGSRFSLYGIKDSQ